MLEEKFQSLTPELQKEVLDFIEFLLVKYSLPQSEKKQAMGKSAGGSLQKYANPKMIPKEKSAWQESAVEKYVSYCKK